MASDRVTAAVAELYGADPGEFIPRRKALADAARAAGDREAAKEITALRKPTRAAWVVNRLARADPGAPQRLADLAARLRAAAEAKDGRGLRELSVRRGELVDGLTARALDAAGVADPPAGLREDVTATLTAALADPETAAQFAGGTLTRAAEWAGFGLLPPSDEPEDAAPADAGRAGAAEGAPGEAAAEAPAAPAEPATAAKSRIPPPQAERPRLHAVPAAPRQTATAPGRAQTADEIAARRQKAIDDAERMVASAAEAATAAVIEEERLEDTVRDLEERLTKARADLSGARMRARRAEAAERKARQDLGRLLPALALSPALASGRSGRDAFPRRSALVPRASLLSPRVAAPFGSRSKGYGWAVSMPADLRAAVLRSSRAA